MSTFLQSSFNARSAENTSSIISPGNSTQTSLGIPNGSFTGAWVPSAFYSVLQITAKADSLIQILVEQSFLGVVADQVSDAFYNTQDDINILRAAPFYAYITLPFMRILVSNIDTIENTIFELATKLTSTPPPQNVHVIVDSGTVTITGPLPEGTNSIGYVRDTAYNTTAEAWQALQIDAGNLKVVEANSADIKTAVESLNTNVVLCDTDNVVIESGSISVDNFPATQPISGNVSIVGALPEGTNSLGSVTAWAYNVQLGQNTSLVIESDSNLKVVEKNSTDILTATNSINTKITMCDTDNVIIESGTITIDNFPELQLVAGENANFTFYPTAANNTAAIYADGTPGTNVAGGWKYTNLATGKINWYLYASASPDTDYKVSDLTSMYTVINQQSSLGLSAAQNPWFMIYTRPDSGANSAGWYKSKLFFGSNAHTDILGLKLLYIGADPVAIHPEITGVNRIQLQFNSALSSNKQLIDVQTESIMLGSLQTTNNTPAGQFDFTFTEYGIDWVQTPAVLPIEFGKVQVQDVAAEASLVAINTKITTCNTGAVVISSGSVSVSNFPATQPISGSVSISSGTVMEINSANILAATNSIDAKITACDTGAVVISSGSVSVSNFPATQPISGSVSISSGTVTETNSSAILSAVDSIDAKITACNTGAVVISSGTIHTQSSNNATTQATVPTVPVTSGVKWNGPSSSMSNFSMIQVAIKASATSVTSSMLFSIEYSPNNTDWFTTGEVLAFTNGGPLNIMTAGAAFTCMTHVRVSYDPPALSTDTASNVVVYLLKKSS